MLTLVCFLLCPVVHCGIVYINESTCINSFCFFYAEVPKITSIIAAMKFINLEYNVLLRDPQSDLSVQRTKEVTNGVSSFNYKL